MKRLNQNGELNLLLIPLVLVSILLVATVVYAFSIYGHEQDYKNNSGQKVAAAVKVAQAQQQKVDLDHYTEVAKNPLRTYTGPSDFGSVKIKYPRTWSLYVDTSDQNNPVDGYGYPGVVPGQNSDQSNSYALRFQVNSTPYDEVVDNYKQQVESKQVAVKPYKPKNIKGVVGIRVTGQVQDNKTGDMIILPLRNQTFEIWTESNKFQKDFDKYILPNFSFIP